MNALWHNTSSNEQTVRVNAVKINKGETEIKDIQI